MKQDGEGVRKNVAQSEESFMSGADDSFVLRGAGSL